MIYLEYELYKAKYLDALEVLNEYLSEKERIITKTMPNAIRYDKDITTTGVPDETPLESYIIELEKSQIDKKLAIWRDIVEGRKRLLECKREELMQSQALCDKVYRMKYFDGYGINKIAKILHYSRAQIYRIYGDISKKCKT